MQQPLTQATSKVGQSMIARAKPTGKCKRLLPDPDSPDGKGFQVNYSVKAKQFLQKADSSVVNHSIKRRNDRVDAYFSADVETDGPIPGPYSMLSFAIVYAGTFDGEEFLVPCNYENLFYRELRPISDTYQSEALQVNKIDRNRLSAEGMSPAQAMLEAYDWIETISAGRMPVLVAYPLSFDWTWLYWYFIQFCREGSPFDYSRCFDIKTAVAVKTRSPISSSGRAKLPVSLQSSRVHTHHAIDDAIEQAEIFAKVFGWDGKNGGNR